MLGHSRAYDLPAIVGKNDHNVEQPKRSGHHNEHIDRCDAFGLIAQEAAPGRGRLTSSSHHVLGDGRLADRDAELEQLTVDPGAPQSGLALLICRIRSRISRSTDGRPDLERQRQNSRNP